MNVHEDPETCYRSYMLRMWRKRDSQGQPGWCASLEEAGSHQTATFGDMRDMCAFLLNRLGVAQPGEPAPPAPPPEHCDPAWG